MRKRVVAIALGEAGSQLMRSTASITRGVVRWAEREGWELLNLTAWRLRVPSATRVDGLIFCRRFNEDSRLKELVERMPHSVEIGSPKAETARPSIVVDWEAVGLQAAEYYLDRGFRNFALAAYRKDELTHSLHVFKDRIEQAGGHCETVRGMHLDGVDMGELRESVRKQLRALTYPLGIFCANDRLAARLCYWCLEEGIAIPEQAAILGYGNDTMTCLTNPVPLSSVDPGYEQHGIEAARRLQQMMDGETAAADATVLVPPSGIVTRRSTDITAIQDTRAARALRYIWDHYMENIGPEDVARFCEIPRRSLDRSFKKALGRTIGKEIMRQRLAKAREMLVASDMPAADVAARVGFRTPQYFNFQFKKHLGCTPQQYRVRERGQT